MSLPLTTTIAVEQPNGRPVTVALSDLHGSTVQDANSVTLISKLTSRRITIADIKAGKFGAGERVPAALGAQADNASYLASDIQAVIS